WQGPAWWPDHENPRRSDGSWPLSEASKLRGPPMNACYYNYGVLKFKIWRGELYGYGTSFLRAAHWTNRMYRNYLVEQLLAVMWLYKDFPEEMDIFYCWWDTPCQCDLKVPFLQASSQYIGKPTTADAAASSLRRPETAPAWQQSAAQHSELTKRQLLATEALPADADLSQLLDITVLRSSFLMFEDGSHRFNRKTPTTRGWLWVYPDTWRELSLAPEQLRLYSDCLVARARNASLSSHRQKLGATDDTEPAAYNPTDDVSERRAGSDNTSADEPDIKTDLQPWPRIPRLVWRGRATGYIRGWNPVVAHDHQWRHSSKLGSLLLNKRLYMSLLARPYPWMDVGITGLVPDPMSGFRARGSTAGPQMDKQIMMVVGKPNVTMEAWAQYDLTLSVDGFGPPWRLPRQLLGMTPIVKVDSPFKEWFARRLQPGVHYEPVEYDLSSLAYRTKQLIAEAHSGSDRLHRMAIAAREMAIDDFHAIRQVRPGRPRLVAIGIGQPTPSSRPSCQVYGSLPYQANEGLLDYYHNMYC
ncbi:uncharacterized protein HaLaN_03223, partial [Haematococcus lacustris]